MVGAFAAAGGGAIAPEGADFAAWVAAGNPWRSGQGESLQLDS